MLHGFTQTGRCLGPIADALDIEHCLVRPDLPGHGDATDLADMDLPAIARHLGVAWNTCWSAVKAAASTRLADPSRLENIKTLGVDEHIWRPSKSRASTRP